MDITFKVEKASATLPRVSLMDVKEGQILRVKRKIGCAVDYIALTSAFSYFDDKQLRVIGLKSNRRGNLGSTDAFDVLEADAVDYIEVIGRVDNFSISYRELL